MKKVIGGKTYVQVPESEPQRTKMKITKEWLKKQNACKPGYDWFIRQYDTDHELVIASLMKIDRFDWANWLIVRLMNKAQKVKYASYAARLALMI